MYWSSLIFVPLLFSHWIGQFLTFIYLLIIFLTYSLKRLKVNNFNFNYLFLFLILLLSIFFVIQADKILFSPTSLNFRYTIQYLSLFILVGIFWFNLDFKNLKIEQIAKLIFWISFLSIFLEFILVNFFGLSKAVFPTAKMESESYYSDVYGFHRPWGLTGSPSANGGILLLSYLFLYELKIKSFKYNFLTLIATIMTISGQAILTGAAVGGYLFIKSLPVTRGFRIIIYICFALIFYLILQADLLQKISLDYIYTTFVRFSNLETTLFSLDSLEWMSGTLGDIVLREYTTSEVYPFTFIFLWGIPLFIFFWGAIYFFVSKTSMPILWFLAIFVSSLHYPTILFIEAQLIIVLIFLNSFKENFFKIR